MAKTVYDAMFYYGQPDLRPLGLNPLYVVYDGVLNRAGSPEAHNAAPGSPYGEKAWRRVARCAMGIEDNIHQSQWCRPMAYNRVPQPICIDIENTVVLDALDAGNPDITKRPETIRWLCDMIAVMRDEASFYNRTISVGAYYPLHRFASNLHPNDPLYKPAMEQAERDFAPLNAVLDVAYPAWEIHTQDIEFYKAAIRPAINYLTKIMPGKPIIPFVPPHYSHYSPPEYRFYLMSPTKMWIPTITWLLSQPEISGLSMWGGVKFLGPNPDGTLRISWRPIETFAINAVKIAQSS